MTPTTDDVMDVLATVMDPELPVVSIVDLGIVARAEVLPDAIEVDLLPTFSGCPALDVIGRDVEAALRAWPDLPARVRFVNDPPWTTDRMSERARDALAGFGVAPPPVIQIGTKPTPCPYCGGETSEESAFGPTPCRSIRYCPTCKNPSEAFKVKGPLGAAT